MRNKKTGKTKDMECSISEMEQFEVDNPNWEAVIGAPLIADSGRVMGVNRPSDDFRDKLRKIQKNHPLGSIRIR